MDLESPQRANASHAILMILQFYVTTPVRCMDNCMDKSAFTPFQCLMEAAEHGNADEVQRLIPLCPSQNLNNMVLWMAVSRGHNRCIELLIPVSDPQDNNSGALPVAAAGGNCDGVKLLLPVSHPKDTSTALIAAAHNGNAQCETKNLQLRNNQ